MTDTHVVVSVELLCRAAGVTPAWLDERRSQGLVPGADAPADADLLRRLRSMHRLERDFDAAPELAALVADLEDEVRRLRARLQRAGLL